MTQAPNYLPEVRKQYEGYPYPERNPEDEKKRLIVPYGARMDMVSHHCFGGRQSYEDFHVLIAGAGTGDSVMLWAEQLRGRKNSRVVYLDMTTASMEIAKERARLRGLDNIDWVNDSILNVPGLDIGAFDLIESSGVLHHLADPDAGLRALKTKLKPEGAMSLMVYAQYGRTGVYQMQELMRLVNAGETDDQQKIDNAKIVLQSLPPTNWFSVAQKYICNHHDIANDPGIYDLLLHPQDRAYTILEAHQWLGRCGLKMTSEPGTEMDQERYLPHTYIKDARLLKKIEGAPVEIQQAIGELIAGNIARQTFFAIPQEAPHRVAALDDPDMVPYQGLWRALSPAELSAALVQLQGQPLVIQRSNGKVYVAMENRKHTAAILGKIDGKRTVAEIAAAVQKSPADAKEIAEDFRHLFTSLNRAHMLFLRHKGTAPYPSIDELERRVKE